MTTAAPVLRDAATTVDNDYLLEVKDLSTQFVDPERGPVLAIRDVSLALRRGETLGVVGESGSGKSVTMASVLGLVRYTGGRVISGEAWFDGEDLLTLPPRRLREIRGGGIGMIFQDPMTSLNPVLTIGYQITEALRRHLGMRGDTARRRTLELLDMVRIPDARGRMKSFPHELSGGMRQRVMIAIALACNPALLIADEPTTALDVTVQAQILELIGEFARESEMAVILISHDLGVVAGLADRVTVMYSGRVIETGTVRDVFKRPRHPYTLGLLRSSPRIDVPRTRLLPAIGGTPPDPAAPPNGCAFHPRCPFVLDGCDTELPLLRLASGHRDGIGHQIACWADLTDDAVFGEQES